MRAALAVLALLLFAGPVAAQSRVTVTPFIGALLTDGDFDALPSEFPDLEVPVGLVDDLPDLHTVREVRDGVFLGVRLNVDLDDRWSVEASYGHAGFDVRVRSRITLIEEPTTVHTFEVTETRLHLWEASLQRRFGDRAVRPFVAVGFGGATSRTRFADPDLAALLEFEGFGTSTSLVGVLGGGLVWTAGPRVSVRGDVRDHVHDCGDTCPRGGTLHDVEVSTGIEVTL